MRENSSKGALSIIHSIHPTRPPVAPWCYIRLRVAQFSVRSTFPIFNLFIVLLFLHIRVIISPHHDHPFIPSHPALIVTMAFMTIMAILIMMVITVILVVMVIMVTQGIWILSLCCDWLG